MRRLLALVGAVVLVDTMFFVALTPLLPEYTEELDLSKAGAGVLAAAYPLGVLLMGLPSGFATARFGPKPCVLIGLAVLAVTTVTFGLAQDYAILVGARFAQGAGSAFAWTAGLAWLVAAAPADRRGELIGSAMAAAIVGALLGPVVGGVASEIGTELAFGAIAVLTAALAVWAILTPAPGPPEPLPARRVLTTLAQPQFLGAAWFVALPALLFGTLGVLAPLRLDALGASALAIGAAFLVAAAIEATLSPILGRASDRRGRLVPIRIGLVASAAVAALLPWLDDRWLLSAGIVAAGVSFGTFWAPAMSRLADLAEHRGLEHAHGFALINVAWAPGQSAGAAGGGALAQATADAVPFLVLGTASVLTFLLLWRSGASS